MNTQISHILVSADDLDDAICEVEAVLEPNNWDFFKMVTPIEGNNRKDGLRPLNAADIGSDEFIKILKDFDNKRSKRIQDLIDGIGDLTVSQLVEEKPDDIYRISQAIRLAYGDFLQDSPFLDAIELTTDVTESLIEDIILEPEAFYLMPVKLILV